MRQNATRTLGRTFVLNIPESAAFRKKTGCLPAARLTSRQPTSAGGAASLSPSRRVKKRREAPYLSRVPFPRVFELLAANLARPGPVSPQPRSLHLNYRNGCVIISRTLIPSPPGGHMVHAARATTASAPPPLPTCHFLIASRQILKFKLTRQQKTSNFFLTFSFFSFPALPPGGGPARRGGPT